MFNPNLPAVYEITYTQPVAPRVTHTFIGRIPSNTFQDCLSITPHIDGTIQIHASTNHTAHIRRVLTTLQNKGIVAEHVPGEFGDPGNLIVSINAPYNSPEITKYLDAIKAHIFTGHLAGYEQHLSAIISGDELTDTEDNDDLAP
ncbi:MAG: hypothetical protein P1U32_00565 [Legionellaceae bacterium]|nr:hypothetical protein [Legionellaceae bacterium]